MAEHGRVVTYLRCRLADHAIAQGDIPNVLSICHVPALGQVHIALLLAQLHRLFLSAGAVLVHGLAAVLERGGSLSLRHLGGVRYGSSRAHVLTKGNDDVVAHRHDWLPLSPPSRPHGRHAVAKLSVGYVGDGWNLSVLRLNSPKARN